VAGVSSSPGLGGLVKSFASWRSLSASLGCVALPKCKSLVPQPTLVRGYGNQNYCEGVTYDVEGLELSYVSSSSPTSLFWILTTLSWHTRERRQALQSPAR
jgi:hypothetical protein